MEARGLFALETFPSIVTILRITTTRCWIPKIPGIQSQLLLPRPKQPNLGVQYSSLSYNFQDVKFQNSSTKIPSHHLTSSLNLVSTKRMASPRHWRRLKSVISFPDTCGLRRSFQRLVRMVSLWVFESTPGLLWKAKWAVLVAACQPRIYHESIFVT